jgi:MFS family permease
VHTRTSTAELSTHPDLRRRAWRTVALLVMIQIVNYADKSVAGLTAHDFIAELKLTQRQYALIASSFFSLYAIGGLMIAFTVAHRVRPRILLAALLACWSLFQFPVAFAASLPMMLACRTALGMAEGAGTPTSFNVCHEWFRDDDRNMPTAMIGFGSLAGSLLAAPALSTVIQHFGWRAAFLACGSAGFVMLAIWLLVSQDGPGLAVHARGEPLPATHEGTVTARDLWTDQTVIGNVVAGLCAYWVIGFSVAWLAPFVRESLGFDAQKTGWILSLSYLAQALILLSISYGSQRALKRGGTSRAARGQGIALCLFGSAAMFGIGALVPQPGLRVAALTVAIGLVSPVFSLGPSMLSEIAPAAERNRLMSIIIALITISAVFAPLLTGTLLQNHGWPVALLGNVPVPLIGALVSWVTLHPERTRLKFERLLVSRRPAVGVA